MSEKRTQIPVINFKQVPGGYVYRESYRWRLGRVRHYLVNDDQKAALLAVIVSKRPILSQVIMWSTLCLMVTIACVGTWLHSGHDSPTALDILAIIALTVAQVIPALAIFFWWKRRRLRPLLATLTPTDLPITRAELRAALANGVSAKQLMIIGVIAVVASTAMLVEAAMQLASQQPTGLLWLVASFFFADQARHHFRRLLARAEKPLMTDTPQDQAQQTNACLTSRVERAEKELKGLRFALPAFAILAIVPHLMQLDKPTVVSAKSVIAESFAVKSAGGDIVAQFSASRDGSPSIAFLDANKKIRLMASVSASGPSVSLLDPQGVSRATLSLNHNSDPSLTLFNADKLPRSMFAIDAGGSGHLVIYGAAGGLDLAANDGRVRWTPLSGAPVDALPVTK